MKNFHANKTQNMSGQHRESVKSAANPHSTRGSKKEREGQMMAIKSKHKAPTLTILGQKQSWAGETTAALRGECLKGACHAEAWSCQLVLFCTVRPIFVSSKRQTEMLKREEKKGGEQNDTEICFNAAHFLCFSLQLLFAFFVVCECECSSSLPHIVLHLCSDSSKNAVCLSPPPLLPSSQKRTATCATS